MISLKGKEPVAIEDFEREAYYFSEFKYTPRFLEHCPYLTESEKHVYLKLVNPDYLIEDGVPCVMLNDLAYKLNMEEVEINTLLSSLEKKLYIILIENELEGLFTYKLVPYDFNANALICVARTELYERFVLSKWDSEMEHFFNPWRKEIGRLIIDFLNSYIWSESLERFYTKYEALVQQARNENRHSFGVDATSAEMLNLDDLSSNQACWLNKELREHFEYRLLEYLTELSQND